ncbi:Uncharacterized protein FKW44_022451 [Caligus rogercresseyi]|uniref:Uncharacterized protein n=1 Tax=Caligus rogercresseyi TaxID=217165 RepID=A0A7T8JUG3_CALRO|nr:Uncharacterized protein FKW44_022451 [Caligus rogercresseyi]
MASERNTRVKVHALLDGEKTPTEISRLWAKPNFRVPIGKNDNIERKRGSGRKAKVDLKVIKKALEPEQLKSMRTHAKDMGSRTQRLRGRLKCLGGRVW